MEGTTFSRGCFASISTWRCRRLPKVLFAAEFLLCGRKLATHSSRSLAAPSTETNQLGGHQTLHRPPYLELQMQCKDSGRAACSLAACSPVWRLISPPRQRPADSNRIESNRAECVEAAPMLMRQVSPKRALLEQFRSTSSTSREKLSLLRSRSVSTRPAQRSSRRSLQYKS